MSIKKPVIVIVISDDLFVRNYVLTGVIKSLGKKYCCWVIASDQVTIRSPLEKLHNFKGYFHIDPLVQKAHYNLFNVLMWRYRKRSKSFYFRFLRLMRADLLRLFGSHWDILKRLLKFARWNLIQNRWPLYCLLFGSKVLFPIFLAIYSRHLKLNAELKMLIQNLSPAAVLFPSSAYDPVGNDVVRIARETSIKSIFLIDNWDNLSSKSLYLYAPNYLGVWGEQSREHAIKIHGISRERVEVIGTPRFDMYYRLRDRAIKSHFSFRYALFVGCAIPFDETTALKIIDNEIESHREKYRGLKVVYRPHPWRQTRLSEIPFRQADFRHIVLDPQMIPLYNGSLSSGSFQPDLNYYPSLLKNAVFVIGPLTTMLVESMIFYKQVLALIYDDGIHLTSPDKAYKYFEHFRGIDRLNGIHFCTSSNQLGLKFADTLRNSSSSNRSRSDHLGYFLYHDKRSYLRRLEDFLLDVLKRPFLKRNGA